MIDEGAVVEFAGSLARFCTASQASVVSWFRTKAYNARTGGLPGSAHLTGLAADVVFDKTPDAAWLADLADRLGLEVTHTGILGRDHVEPKS